MEETDTKPINQSRQILVIDNILEKKKIKSRMSDGVEERLLLELLNWEDALEELPVQQRTC